MTLIAIPNRDTMTFGELTFVVSVESTCRGERLLITADLVGSEASIQIEVAKHELQSLAQGLTAQQWAAIQVKNEVGHYHLSLLGLRG